MKSHDLLSLEAYSTNNIEINFPAIEKKGKFEELTNEIVLAWIQADVSDREDLINASIQKQIDDKESSVSKMPWAPVVETPDPTPAPV